MENASFTRAYQTREGDLGPPEAPELPVKTPGLPRESS